MKFSGNQRKLYLLSAVLIILTVALCFAWSAWREPSNGQPAVTPVPTADAVQTLIPMPSPTPSLTGDAVATGGQTLKTVVYYQDDYGYLVPVSRTIPAEAGVAKATLSLMVKSAYNDMEAARLGLRTVLPENCTIDLDVMSDGTARIDLGKEVLKLTDAQAESNMVAAVVQTLTEFDSVKRVNFLVDGQKRAALTHGTRVEGDFERGTLNLESAQNALSPAEAKAVMLYFPGETSSLIVPVTRMVYGANDINTAVLELAKGPSGNSPLDNALPSGCGLIGVEVKNRVAMINFTQDFMRIAENTDGGRMALKALVLTCTQFEGVDGVEIMVEGKPYDPGASALAVPTFVNDAASISEAAIRTQSAAILNID